MDPIVLETAQRVDYEKQDLQDLITFFCSWKMFSKFLTGRISTNPNEELWIPDSRGWTDAKYREYFEDAPRILLEVAESYRSNFREEGGRFWFDWFGAYSIRDHVYFVRWAKSLELTIYASELRKGRRRFDLRDSIIHRLTDPWVGNV